MHALSRQTRHRATKRGWSAALLFLGILTLFLALVGARAEAIDYTGHYELTNASADWVFAIDIAQTGSKADVSFSASMVDGSGAAPEGGGKGVVDKTGVLTFKFKDSFDNEGAGTLVLGRDGYRLEMDVTTVVEPRPLRFYGDVLLKKTADKPSP
jgi:hypothetical protein